MNAAALSSALGILPTSSAVKAAVSAREAAQCEDAFRWGNKQECQKRPPTMYQEAYANDLSDAKRGARGLTETTRQAPWCRHAAVDGSWWRVVQICRTTKLLPFILLLPCRLLLWIVKFAQFMVGWYWFSGDHQLHLHQMRLTLVQTSPHLLLVTSSLKSTPRVISWRYFIPCDSLNDTQLIISLCYRHWKRLLSFDHRKSKNPSSSVMRSSNPNQPTLPCLQQWCTFSGALVVVRHIYPTCCHHLTHLDP